MEGFVETFQALGKHLVLIAVPFVVVHFGTKYYETKEPPPDPDAPPRIFAGADPFGEDLKDALVARLRKKGYDVVDGGTGAYYDVASTVAKQVQRSRNGRGLLMCGTGMGMGIVANKFTGVRAATVENVDAARCSRALPSGRRRRGSRRLSRATSRQGSRRQIASRIGRRERSAAPPRPRAERLDGSARGGRAPDRFPAGAINDSNVLCLGGKMTSPADGGKILDAWLAQKFGIAPGNPAPAWWSTDVETFVKGKWPALEKVEAESRKH